MWAAMARIGLLSMVDDRWPVGDPDVATYDEKPEMSAREAAATFTSHWQGGDYSFGIINFANPDMVGHTGVIPAAVAAVEEVDARLGEVVSAVHAKGGALIIDNLLDLSHTSFLHEGILGNADTVESEIVVKQDGANVTVERHARDATEQGTSTAQELRSSNEELQAMNEELRSAAEELETSKEELQSVNEEMITVNHELKEKVEELLETVGLSSGALPAP